MKELKRLNKILSLELVVVAFCITVIGAASFWAFYQTDVRMDAIITQNEGMESIIALRDIVFWQSEYEVEYRALGRREYAQKFLVAGEQFDEKWEEARKTIILFDPRAEFFYKSNNLRDYHHEFQELVAEIFVHVERGALSETDALVERHEFLEEKMVEILDEWQDLNKANLFQIKSDAARFKNLAYTIGLFGIIAVMGMAIAISRRFFTPMIRGLISDLAAERNRIELIITNLSDGLIILNLNKVVTLVNPRAEEILGIQKEDVVGRSLDKLSNQNLRKISKIIKEKTFPKYFIEEKIPLIYPRQATIQFIFAPIIDARGEVASFLGLLHDISREEAIASIKSQFVSIAAHQLRTPLSAVKWTLHMLLSGDFGKITERQRGFIKRGNEANERMIHLVSDLLDVARIEEGKFGFEFKEESLEDLIQKSVGTFRLISKKKNVKLIFHKPRAPFPKIETDRERIALVLQNLIDNALRYTPSGGRVDIRIKKKNDKFLQVSIEDTGVGIPRHQLPRLFTQFFRGENVMRMQTEGTGLGLYIVKNIIEGHRGKIWAKSEEGMGSTFFFTLPISEEVVS